jgi:2-polyprenyl-3-methyl-5-hydroxy-6-metoxy-1,4-benzoquinol methylase
MSKLDQFVQLLNIPIKLNWENYFKDENNNCYSYLKSLNLISSQELSDIYKQKRVLNRNLNIDVYIKDLNYHFNNGVKDKRIADIGAGWGFLTFWLLLNGAKHLYVTGDEFRCDFILKIHEEGKKQGIFQKESKVTAICRWINYGDEVLDKLVELESIDLFVFNDVFEHIPFYKLPSVFQVCYNHLKKGGQIISKTHNTKNPNTLRAVIEYWSEIEEKKEIADRVAIIKKEYLNIEDEHVIQILAKHTRGMVRKEFIEALKKYIENGEIPKYNPIGTSYDILFDEAHEGPTDFDTVIGMMRKVGFQSKVFPAMYNRRRSRPFQRIAEVVPSVFFSLNIFDEAICFLGKK